MSLRARWQPTLRKSFTGRDKDLHRLATLTVPTRRRSWAACTYVTGSRLRIPRGGRKQNICPDHPLSKSLGKKAASTELHLACPRGSKAHHPRAGPRNQEGRRGTFLFQTESRLLKQREGRTFKETKGRATHLFLDLSETSCTHKFLSYRHRVWSVRILRCSYPVLSLRFSLSSLFSSPLCPLVLWCVWGAISTGKLRTSSGGDLAAVPVARLANDDVYIRC